MFDFVSAALVNVIESSLFAYATILLAFFTVIFTIDFTTKNQHNPVPGFFLLLTSFAIFWWFMMAGYRNSLDTLKVVVLEVCVVQLSYLLWHTRKVVTGTMPSKTKNSFHLRHAESGYAWSKIMPSFRPVSTAIHTVSQNLTLLTPSLFSAAM
jgi:hypothetical protein